VCVRSVRQQRRNEVTKHHSNKAYGAYGGKVPQSNILFIYAYYRLNYLNSEVLTAVQICYSPYSLVDGCQGAKQNAVVSIFKVSKKKKQMKSERKCVLRMFCCFNLDTSIIAIFADQIRHSSAALNRSTVQDTMNSLVKRHLERCP